MLEFITEESIVGERIVGFTSRVTRVSVVVILGEGDSIGVVGCGLFNGGDESLFEEELGEVVDLPAGVGAVGYEGGADVGDDVFVGCSSAVVAWEKGVEVYDSVGVRHLCTAEPEGVESSLTTVGYARVYTGGVAGPDVYQDLRCWFAGLDVHELHLEVHWYAFLVLDEVLADLLAFYVVWTVGVVGCHDT